MKVSKHTKIVYIGDYFVLTYIERFFSTVYIFLSYFCWLVNCTNWVNKFHNCFLTCSETEESFICEVFQYCHLCKVKFQLPSTFLVLSIWSVNCSSHFFSHFLFVSKFEKVSLWFWRCPETEVLIYIGDLLLLLFMESSVFTVRTYSEFSWPVNRASLICKLFLLFQISWTVLILEVFSSKKLRRVSFNF